ncbi:S-adenosyl-L-methionine-dependent methyltransferase [Blastocladiella britannica]|nr:S-adenosyl-L-methionine-dependent methyltransferase [Blastocladiella britannica]
MLRSRLLLGSSGRRMLTTATAEIPPIITSTSSADPAEIAKFNRLAAQWWDPHGDLALLHRMNPVRIAYMRDWLAVTGAAPLPASVVAPPRSGSATDIGAESSARPLSGTRMLDVGCGAGLLSEPLARLGASVTGIDAAESNVLAARAHAANDPALRRAVVDGDLVYRHITAESLAAEEAHRPFDAVCALEIIEHVTDARAFLSTLLSLVPTGHPVFVSTMNRTALSKLLTVTLAENALGIVAKGTHDPAKYVTPAELRSWAWAAGGHVVDVEALWLDPVRGQWSRGNGGWPERAMVNYIACIKKRA